MYTCTQSTRVHVHCTCMCIAKHVQYMYMYYTCFLHTCTSIWITQKFCDRYRYTLYTSCTCNINCMYVIVSLYMYFVLSDISKNRPRRYHKMMRTCIWLEMLQKLMNRKNCCYYSKVYCT